MDFFLSFLPIPLWLSFLINSIAFFIAFNLGTLLGNRYRPSSEQESLSPIGSVVFTMLGFAVVVLSITYGIGFIKYNASQELFLNEANAIEIVYLRAGYLKDSDRRVIRALLKDYVYLRYNMFKSENFNEGLRKTEKLHDRLWQYTDELAKSNPNSVTLGLFIQALSEALDFQEKHVNQTVGSKLPWPVWVVLYAITALAIINMGYFFRITQTHHVVNCFFLILTFSALMSLILELNYLQRKPVLIQHSLIEVMSNMFNE